MNKLIDYMKLLINDADLAKQIGFEGKKTAIERFHIKRFITDWQNTFEEVTNHHFNPVN